MSHSDNAREPGASILIRDIAFCAAAVLLLHLLFSMVSGKYLFSRNDYNSYVLQAQSWLSGRLDVEYRSWLELAEYGGKYYVSFPPFPSYVLLLPVMIFGSNVDGCAALLSMLLGVAFAVKLCHKAGLDSRKAVLLTCLLYLGTNMWQITVDAWVWFLAQNFSVTLTLAALYAGLCGRRGTSVFLLACAVGCRPFQIVYLPVIFLLLWRSGEKRSFPGYFFRRFYVYLPALALGASYMVLNQLRFENPFEFGHNYLPEFTQAAKGQFSLSYVPQNFQNLFRFSDSAASGPWQFPKFDGMNLFLVTPLFALLPVFAAAAFFRKQERGSILFFGLCCLLICVHLFCILLHKTMGGYHFGNRYLLDTVPLVFYLTAAAAAAMRRDSLFYAAVQLALLLGLAVNFYGTLTSYLAAP